MFHHTQQKRQFPVGLFAVLMLLVGCVFYAANEPEENPSQASPALTAEPLLFNGIYQDDPKLIRQAVALYGQLPEELGEIAINMAASGKHPLAVAELLKCGVPVESRTLHGQTALISAAETPDNAAMVKQLLDAGANPTAISFDGHTAIGNARAIGDQESINALTAAIARTRLKVPAR
jgi:ankyrin repeat protein